MYVDLNIMCRPAGWYALSKQPIEYCPQNRLEWHFVKWGFHFWRGINIIIVITDLFCGFFSSCCFGLMGFRPHHHSFKTLISRSCNYVYLKKRQITILHYNNQLYSEDLGQLLFLDEYSAPLLPESKPLCTNTL